MAGSPQRTAVRGLFLVLAILLAWPITQADWPRALLPALSPFLALGSVVSLRQVGLLMLLAVPVVLLLWFVPRALCRFVCPAGFVQAGIARLSPAHPACWQRVPRLGSIIALFSLGGAVLGYPVFLWLDPLGCFQGFLNAWHMPLSVAALLAGLPLLGLLLLSCFLPHAWCNRICPLGATQDWLTWAAAKCRRCKQESPGDAGGQFPPSAAPGRREFFAACAGAALGGWLGRDASARAPLRPPGAVPEAHFAGVCIRCGNCARVCPSGIIHPDLGALGAAHLLTPTLDFTGGFCRPDCNRCTQACPSGAIVPLPLAQKNQQVIGQARINLETCWLAGGRECTACIRACPYSALAIRSSADGFSSEPAVDRHKCNGCGACEAVCPVRPLQAVKVVGKG